MLGSLGGDPAKLLPNNSSLSSTVVTGAAFEADEEAPASVIVTLDGNTLVWSKSASNDVIGYRVYSTEGQLIATNGFEQGRRAQIAIGANYYVVAVDITGRQSEPSNIIETAAPPPEIDEPNTDEDNEPPVPEEPPTGDPEGNGEEQEE